MMPEKQIHCRVAVAVGGIELWVTRLANAWVEITESDQKCLNVSVPSTGTTATQRQTFHRAQNARNLVL
jgi:hypothetical protein